MLDFYSGRQNGQTIIAERRKAIAQWEMPPIGHPAREFVEGVIANHLKVIAQTEIELVDLEIRRAAATAAKNPTQTAAAIAHPSLICYKCDGKGKIRGFGHIEGGKCFACNGAGVRNTRRCA